MDPYGVEGLNQASDNLGQNPTLGGSYWSEAGTSHSTVSAQTQQLRRRQFQRTLPSHPGAPVWGRGLQVRPDLYSSPVRQSLGPQNQISGVGFQSLGYDVDLQNCHDSAIYSPYSDGFSRQFRHIMSNDPRSNLPDMGQYPANYESDDSQTLRGSQDASQDGTLDPHFDISGDVTYPFTNEATPGYPAADGVRYFRGHHTSDYPPNPLPLGQHGQYLESWQNCGADMPWSHINPPREHSAVLTLQPCTFPLSDDVLDCHADGRPMQQSHSSFSYPSQIASPVTEAAWNMNEIELLDHVSPLPGLLPDSVEVPYQNDNRMVFQGQIFTELPTQDQAEREYGPHLRPSFNRMSSQPRGLWPPVDVPRSGNVIPEDPLSTEQTLTRNNDVPKEMKRAIDDTFYNSEETSSDHIHQASPIDEIAAATTSSDCRWQHSIASKDGLQQLDGQTTLKENKKKKAVRTGPLDPESKNKAGQMRKIGACWRCWLLHLNCSLVGVCPPCQASPFSLQSHPCIRNPLHDFTDLFFPSILSKRRLPSTVQHEMDENISSFTTNRITVYMSAGPGYPPMRITSYEFLLKTNRARDFLSLYYAPANVHTSAPTLEQVCAPPLGLKEGKDDSKLRDSCEEHISGITEHSRFSKEATDGDASLLSRKVYEAVARYRNSRATLGNAELLLRKAINLLAIHFVMSRVITFTKESAKDVVKSLRRPMQFPYGRRVSSRLLNSQIKREMHLLQRALTREVLEDLHKEVRKKEKNSWATCFCVIAILSMCIEAVQIAADGFIVQTMKENNETSPKARDAAIEIALSLEERLFNGCTYIFHMIHRSHEGSNHKGFNPIRDGIEIDSENRIDVSMVQFVEEIRWIMRDYRPVLDEKAENPKWECQDDLLADHYRFRRQNSGRLIAKFLKSFIEPS